MISHAEYHRKKEKSLHGPQVIYTYLTMTKNQELVTNSQLIPLYLTLAKNLQHRNSSVIHDEELPVFWKWVRILKKVSEVNPSRKIFFFFPL